MFVLIYTAVDVVYWLYINDMYYDTMPYKMDGTLMDTFMFVDIITILH